MFTKLDLEINKLIEREQDCSLNAMNLFITCDELNSKHIEIDIDFSR